MTKKKKSPKQPSEEIQMANPEIKVITGINVKYLSEKQNDYGCNHMFQVLGETPIKIISSIRRRYENTYLGI